MAKKKWSAKQDYELTKGQAKFEQYLNDNGYQITGYRYYNSFNEYRIEKDGIVGEYRFFNGNIDYKYFILAFEDWWNLRAKLIKMGAESNN